MLTGLERFVRIVVERETLVPRSQAPPEAKTRYFINNNKLILRYNILVLIKLRHNK